MLCGPLHQPGFLWAEHFKVLVPFIAINKDYFITMLRACQPLICSGLFCAKTQHFAGIGTRKLGNVVAGNQPGQCFHPALLIQRMDLGIGAVIGYIFLNQQMAVGQCSDCLLYTSDAADD